MKGMQQPESLGAGDVRGEEPAGAVDGRQLPAGHGTPSTEVAVVFDELGEEGGGEGFDGVLR